MPPAGSELRGAVDECEDTQCATQGYDCTQALTGPEDEDSSEDESARPPPKPWGRLVRRHAPADAPKETLQFELVPRVSCAAAKKPAGGGAGGTAARCGAVAASDGGDGSGRSRPAATDAGSDLGEMDAYVVGRARDCEICLSHDARVSSRHCRIFRRWETRTGLSQKFLVVYVEDTSSNGTFLNRARMARHERLALESGDSISLVNPKMKDSLPSVLTFVDLVEKPFVRPPPVGIKPVSHQHMQRSLTLSAAQRDRRVENEYDVREELGSGSIGKVYRAVERASGANYAVKIVATRQFAMEQSFSVEDLLSEARTLRDLSHPCIVSVRDVYSTDEAFSIVMQLVEGGDLFDRIIKRARYPEADARRVCEQVLDALAYLHKRGIAHRDIKPENILLRSREDDVDVLLTDFGLAKGAAVGTQACRTFCGTPQYLAPEVLERQNNEEDDDKRYDGAAADLWSVGIVLFVLLAGVQPKNSNVAEKRSECEFAGPVWAQISDDAKHVVRRLAAIDAAQRPTADAALQLPWFLKARDAHAAKSQQPSKEPPDQPSTPEPPDPPTKRQKQ